MRIRFDGLSLAEASRELIPCEPDCAYDISTNGAIRLD